MRSRRAEEKIVDRLISEKILALEFFILITAPAMKKSFTKLF
jgi:hypothetical protein